MTGHSSPEGYGEVLGVNRVTLNIPPGITSLVGRTAPGRPR